MRPICTSFALFTLCNALAPAQGQTNVRAWHEAGQTWVVWETTGQDPITYDVYAVMTPVPSVAGMEPLGRILRPEWGAARLRLLVPGSHWRVPRPGAPPCVLNDNEGLFVHTPRESSAQYFIVVKHGQTTVTPHNITNTPVSQVFDPAHHPVRPHLQLTNTSVEASAWPTKVYAVWLDGRDDHTDGRPDVPVMANRAKHGMPCVFYITEPAGAALVCEQARLERSALQPAGDFIPACFALHGGGGEYHQFRPGVPSHVPMQLEPGDGILITPDDTIFYRDEGDTVRSGTRWFGWWEGFDPFTDEPRTNAPHDGLIVDYTARRLNWILDRIMDHGPAGLGYVIDPHRVSIVGHSGGGNGAGINGRLRPDRFASIVMYTPGIGLDPDADMCCFPLGGSHAQNLPTSAIGHDNQPVGFTDLLLVQHRLSASERDQPVTRIYVGRNDTVGGAAWSPLMVNALHTIDEARTGAMLFWDERAHGVQHWNTGQWVAPVNTERASVHYLARYRSNQSYPGFFGVDQQPHTKGRQPDPGNGQPSVGDTWGTWGGYIEWDVDSIIDTESEWACTIWVVGMSSVSIDNCPAAEVRGSVAVRKPQAFTPKQGQSLQWTLQRADNGDVLQYGAIIVADDDVVVVPDLLITRDPDRLRLSITPTAGPSCPADLDANGVVDVFDLLLLFHAWGENPGHPADLDESGEVNVFDLLLLFAAWGMCA